MRGAHACARMSARLLGSNGLEGFSPACCSLAQTLKRLHLPSPDRVLDWGEAPHAARGDGGALPVPELVAILISRFEKQSVRGSRTLFSPPPPPAEWYWMPQDQDSFAQKLACAEDAAEAAPWKWALPQKNARKSKTASTHIFPLAHGRSKEV